MQIICDGSIMIKYVCSVYSCWRWIADCLAYNKIKTVKWENCSKYMCDVHKMLNTASERINNFNFKIKKNMWYTLYKYISRSPRSGFWNGTLLLKWNVRKHRLAQQPIQTLETKPGSFFNLYVTTETLLKWSRFHLYNWWQYAIIMKQSSFFYVNNSVDVYIVKQIYSDLLIQTNLFVHIFCMHSMVIFWFSVKLSVLIGWIFNRRLIFFWFVICGINVCLRYFFHSFEWAHDFLLKMFDINFNSSLFHLQDVYYERCLQRVKLQGKYFQNYFDSKL